MTNKYTVIFTIEDFGLNNRKKEGDFLVADFMLQKIKFSIKPFRITVIFDMLADFQLPIFVLFSIDPWKGSCQFYSKIVVPQVADTNQITILRNCGPRGDTCDLLESKCHSCGKLSSFYSCSITHPAKQFGSKLD